MSLDATLQKNNLTANEAWEFIDNHLSNPQLIYDEADNVGISADMLAELASRFDSSISATDVELFFSGAGLDPEALGTPDDTADPSPGSNTSVMFNNEGDAVISSDGPLTDDQLIFVAGIIEASFIADLSGTGQEELLTEQTADGTLINVQFGDRDYPDVIVDLSEQDLSAMNSLVSPILDDVYLNALQQAGFDSFAELESRGSEQDAQAMYDNAEAQIIGVIKPQYDDLMAGQSDIWG